MKKLIFLIILVVCVVPQIYAQTGPIDFDSGTEIDEPQAPINMFIYLFMAVATFLGVNKFKK
jgi:hypothetical protein